jgi:hypothetical protein
MVGSFNGMLRRRHARRNRPGHDTPERAASAATCGAGFNVSLSLNTWNHRGEIQAKKIADCNFKNGLQIAPQSKRSRVAGPKNRQATFITDPKAQNMTSPTFLNRQPGRPGSILHLSRVSCGVVGHLALAALAVSALTGPLRAATVDVPNASFESPTTNYADPAIGSWQKTTQPGWFDPGTFGYTWDQLSGVFLNTAPGQSDHIDNAAGTQAAFLFAVPQAGLTQDLVAPFGIGQSFELTVGLIGGGGSMPAGSIFQIGLYYRDAGNNIVTVVTKDISFDSTLFPSTTHLVDFTLSLPTVQASDAWAGKPIGVELMSAAVTPGGYWDLDNVRLTSIPEPSTWGLAASGLGTMLLMRRRLVRRA